MRSYGQYCAVAKSLDVLGDRWTLLIVRELLLGGACRYTDLRNGLPGIATNLLADRLRELEVAGVVTREHAPPPTAATLFRLTPRGEQLQPLLDELGRWGIPYMAEGPAAEDAFRSGWLAWPAGLFLTDSQPARAPIAIELRTDDGPPLVIETVDGDVRTSRGPAQHPDAVISGTPHAILALLSGQLDFDGAVTRGLQFSGDRAALDRVRPQTSSTVADAR